MYTNKFESKKTSNSFSLFEKLLDYESSVGIKSTFFFASKNNSNHNSNINDVYYDIYNQYITKLIILTQSKGHEIGLHASYNSHKLKSYLHLEKDALEKVIHKNIYGLRHHFWKTGIDIDKCLTNQNDVGFLYDSSIAFNDRPGFRRSIALPYQPWIESKNKFLSIQELPVFCMDTSLEYNDKHLENSLSRLIKLTKLIKNCEGFGVINWHTDLCHENNNFNSKYGYIYKKYLNYLKGEGDVWITNLNNISKWFIERNKKII